MPVVTGVIVFGPDFQPFVGATVYVRLQDVSRLDAPALLVAETVLTDVQVGPAPQDLGFTITAPSLEPRRRYSVRVHVDVDNDGRVGSGDYVSTMSHPVKAGNEVTMLSIPVKRIP